MKTRIILIICLITGIAVHLSANEKIYINREVTTHIVMPENIKMVDISTTKIIGNQCTDNIVRIKPYLENDSISSEGYSENELLGTLTIIGERHIAQYDILYTESPGISAFTIILFVNLGHRDTPLFCIFSLTLSTKSSSVTPKKSDKYLVKNF